MPDLSVKRSLSQIFIGVVLIFIGLWASGLWKSWFGYDKVEVVNQKLIKSDTIISIVSNERVNSQKTFSQAEKEVDQSKRDEKKITAEVNSSKNELLADFLIITTKNNQLYEIVYDLRAAIQQMGSSVAFKNAEDIRLENLKGRYRRLVEVDVKFSNMESTFDSRVTSTNYSYSVIIYDIETGKATTSLNDTGVEVGFSEAENITKIKKLIVKKLKTDL